MSWELMIIRPLLVNDPEWTGEIDSDYRDYFVVVESPLYQYFRFESISNADSPVSITRIGTYEYRSVAIAIGYSVTLQDWTEAEIAKATHREKRYWRMRKAAEEAWQKAAEDHETRTGYWDADWFFRWGGA